MAGAVDLVMPNVAEFNLRHPRLALDPATANSFLLFGRAMADQSVFWSDSPRVLVLHAGVDQLWFSDVHRAVGADPPPLVCPAWRSGLLAADLLADPAAMAELRDHLTGCQQVRFVSWGATEDLYRLAAAIRGFGHEVLLDTPDEERYWTSLYLDSKLSCLDLASQVPGLRVAPCVTTDTWQELRGVVDLMVGSGQTVIVRSVYGSAGEGSAVVAPEAGSLDRFWRSVRDDPLLRVFPLLVQHYVPHQPGLGCPAVDMLIADEETADCAIADLIPSVMTVDVHRFVSVNVGSHVLPTAVAEQVTAVSRAVAVAASRLGFRGWFGIDFLLDRHGELYVTEFNARRTGGTQWIPMLDRCRPRRQAIAHARHTVPLPALAPADVSYLHLRPVFEDLWQQGATVYPTSVRNLSHRRPSYAIVACGPDVAAAEGQAAAALRNLETHFTGVGAGRR
jgi:hypothetical protein